MLNVDVELNNELSYHLAFSIPHST